MIDATISDKGRRRRAQILDAAAAVLIEEGYSRFSARKIADRLGMRLSNVQYYFATPDQIVGGLFTRELERAREAFEARESSGLHALVDFLLDEQSDPGNCRLFWELWALSARDGRTAEIMAGFYESYREAIELAIAQATGMADAAERRRVAVLIMSMIEGLSLFRGHGRRLAGADDGLRETLHRSVRALLER